MLASAWSKVVSLFLAINFRRMLSLYRPAINVSINCSSLSLYSQSLAIMRAHVMSASIILFCWMSTVWPLSKILMMFHCACLLPSAMQSLLLSVPDNGCPADLADPSSSIKQRHLFCPVYDTCPLSATLDISASDGVSRLCVVASMTAE